MTKPADERTAKARDIAQKIILMARDANVNYYTRQIIWCQDNTIERAMTLIESERSSAIKEATKLGEFILGIEPFCHTVKGEDMCAWCRRDRPREITQWQDAHLEENHDADCEFIKILAAIRALGER